MSAIKYLEETGDPNGDYRTNCDSIIDLANLMESYARSVLPDEREFRVINSLQVAQDGGWNDAINTAIKNIEQ